MGVRTSQIGLRWKYQAGGLPLINNKVCQLCGAEVNNGDTRYFRDWGDIPFCPLCELRIKKHMRKAKAIRVNIGMWKLMHESPIALLPSRPEGKPRKDCIYWPP